MISHAVETLHRRKHHQRQWVLSCEPTLLMRWLIPRWNDFTRRHPDIHIHLVAGGGAVSFSEGIDLAIRRNDFSWPEHYHAETLFQEWIGPVCQPGKQAEWFASGSIRAEAPLLHSQTRPQGWRRWCSITHHREPENNGISFEHFYFTLQAAIAGMGITIAPRELVKDDLASGLLVAPLGFVEGGCLLLFTDT
ncbi:MAG: HTH-type transcriptional regulator TrpI [Candidatus Erwinia impunctatus]|nr:HTH-type transcriptional regulator TrpI [Culicoides impunctatus]